VGHELDHALPSSSEAQNDWSFASTRIACLHGMDKDNFYFYLICRIFNYSNGIMEQEVNLDKRTIQNLPKLKYHDK
jgi:hypothetical protein